MKKRNLIIYLQLILITFFCYSQDYFYSKSDLEKTDITNQYQVNSKNKLVLFTDYFIDIRNTYDYYGNVEYKFKEILQIQDKNNSNILEISSDKVYLAKYNCKISSFFSNFLWIPDYYYKQLLSENRFDIVLNNESYWKDFDGRFWSGGAEIFDIFVLKTLNFRDYYFYVSGNSWKRDVSFFAKIDQQETNILSYNVERVFDGLSDYNRKDLNGNYDCVDTNLLPYLAENLPYKVYFVFDGDYVNMYLHEISDKNLFQTFIKTTPENCTTIEKWIKNKTDDLSNIIWPHHADGTSEYEDTIRYPEPIVIEEPEEIEIEEYKEPEKKEIPPFPDEKDPNYLEIIKEYYPNIYEDQLEHFEYLNTMKKIKILVISITSVIIMLLILFIIIKNKRKSNKL